MILHRISINAKHPISTTACVEEHAVSMCFFKILIGCFCFFHYSPLSALIIGIKCCLATLLTHPHISCPNMRKDKWCTVHSYPFVQTKYSFKHASHAPSLSPIALKSNDPDVETTAFRSHILCRRRTPQCYTALRLSLIEQLRNTQWLAQLSPGPSLWCTAPSER